MGAEAVGATYVHSYRRSTRTTNRPPTRSKQRTRPRMRGGGPPRTPPGGRSSESSDTYRSLSPSCPRDVRARSRCTLAPRGKDQQEFREMFHHESLESRRMLSVSVSVAYDRAAGA